MATLKPPTALAALLGAAQADAERFHGAGPVARWRPARRSRQTCVAALALAAAAAVSWIWMGSAPAEVEATRSVAGTRLANAATPPASRVADAAPPPERAVVLAQSAPTQAAVIPPTWQPADPDAWALDPQQIVAAVVATSDPTWLRLHNTPAPAEEANAASADESESDTEPGGGHEE